MPQSGRILLAVLACALVCACDDAPPPTTRTPATGASPSSTGKASIVPPQMVSAVSAGRSSLLIGVHFALGTTPVVGKPLPVDIGVVPHQPFESLKVLFSSQEGLRVISGAEMPARSAPAEKLLTHQMVLEPSREGIYMVTAAVETDSEEGNIVRIYSIPVIVSAQAPQPEATPAPAAPAPASG
jgi:hypothetical protein